ncbi:glycerophosphodiester phosphodiesterase family protein [Bacteriovoracaceae bacterium]|nr:glycerophosphodiester phosphodiesterase family protein [Bacteriovoracaceae bacterium]
MKYLALSLLFIFSAFAQSNTKCVAHRGYSGISLENSMKAFKNAHKHKADAIELDLHFSKDGTPIIMHDSTLRRTSSSKPGRKCQLAKKIKKLKLNEIQQNCQLRNGEEIPTLDKLLSYFQDKNIQIFIKIKVKGNKRLIELINTYYSHQLDKIKIISSRAKRFKNLIKIDDFSILDQVDFFNTDFFAFNKFKKFNASYWYFSDTIMSITGYSSKRQIYIWTIDDAVKMTSYFEKGVDYIATNLVSMCTKIRDSQGQ